MAHEPAGLLIERDQTNILKSFTTFYNILHLI